MTIPVRVREARADDMGFIVDTWRRSFEGAPAVNGAETGHLFTELAVMIGNIVKRPGSVVRVACDPDDEDVLLGWAAATGRELHYVYIRGGEPERSMRGHGIVPLLLAGLEIRSYSFRTQSGERRLKPRERGWSFTPRFTF